MDCNKNIKPAHAASGRAVLSQNNLFVKLIFSKTLELYLFFILDLKPGTVTVGLSNKFWLLVKDDAERHEGL